MSEPIMNEPQSVPINAKFGDDFVLQLVVITTARRLHRVVAASAQHQNSAQVDAAGAR